MRNRLGPISLPQEEIMEKGSSFPTEDPPLGIIPKNRAQHPGIPKGTSCVHFQRKHLTSTILYGNSVEVVSSSLKTTSLILL